MLLTITTTYQPATDLSYLLHKHPSRLQSFLLSFGRAHVFYPEASAERCTVALLLDVDTVHLVHGQDKSATLDHYVNDRPYVASSFLSVALSEVFSTALSGRCKARPELVDTPLPLQAYLASVLCQSGESFLRSLFEPLGYTVKVEPRLLDEEHPEWGISPYFAVTLEANSRLCELLTHLYVLIPVLDNDKHYYISDDEVEKLLRRGSGWLESHPEREQITRRYLKHRPDLVHDAIARLVVEEKRDGTELAEGDCADLEEGSLARPVRLHDQRHAAVLSVLRRSGAKRVLDLGCGEGKLLKLLLQDKTFEQITGMDVSYRALELARHKLHLDTLPEKQKERITLLHGALTYRDKRLEGYDAATVIEVIEHLDASRLVACERVLFEFARPTTVVITTPNVEYNVKFGTLASDELRHHDHRFEWSRQQFQCWASQVAERFSYRVYFLAVGPEDALVGTPTQMAVFSREPSNK